MVINWIKTKYVLAILIASYLVLSFFFVGVLNYNFLRSDVLSYWQDSLNWRTPFNEHPPLYPLAIAFVRMITFNKLNPIILMMGLNLVAFSCCIVLIVRFFRTSNANQALAAFGALLFGLWPFVGLTYTVDPLADIPAIALTIAGLVLLQKADYKFSAILFGLAIITHKGVWPIIGLLVLSDFLIRKEFISKRNVLFLVILILPLAILWISGAFYHNSVNWLMARSMQVNTTMSNGIQILGGVIGTFEGGLKGIVKGSIVLLMMAISIITFVVSLKKKFPYYEYCAAISLAVIVMFLFSSAGTIWGPVRFSRFLAIPLILCLNYYIGNKKSSKFTTTLAVTLLLGLFFTQLAYAWYFAKVFFA